MRLADKYSCIRGFYSSRRYKYLVHHINKARPCHNQRAASTLVGSIFSKKLESSSQDSTIESEESIWDGRWQLEGKVNLVWQGRVTMRQWQSFPATLWKVEGYNFYTFLPKWLFHSPTVLCSFSGHLNCPPRASAAIRCRFAFCSFSLE